MGCTKATQVGKIHFVGEKYFKKISLHKKLDFGVKNAKHTH